MAKISADTTAIRAQFHPCTGDQRTETCWRDAAETLRYEAPNQPKRIWLQIFESKGEASGRALEAMKNRLASGAALVPSMKNAAAVSHRGREWSLEGVVASSRPINSSRSMRQT